MFSTDESAIICYIGHWKKFFGGISVKIIGLSTLYCYGPPTLGVLK